jgi:uncharacterized protein (TIGR03067 family)
VTQHLTTRPNLDHFRGQAKTLLAELRAGDVAAARTFIAQLPKARGMSAARVREAGFRLADAQSVIARQNGFSSWAQLTRHVERLRALEGEWHFEALQVDGAEVPRAMIGRSKLLFDGDRFRMESPEGNYDGRFSVDASATPMQIDIEFVEGPEAGNRSYGLFELDGDRLTICLGLVGASRPTTFASRAGSGHALERLRRASAARPLGVTGGVAKGAKEASAKRASAGNLADGVSLANAGNAVSPANPADFAVEMTPALERLEGKWIPVRLVTDGEEMRADWLPFGSRTSTGNEATVVFGGQVMLHVKVRIDDSVSPIAVDYLHLRGRDKGRASQGIMEWIGDEVRFLMAAPGQKRPKDFSSPVGAGFTLSQWRRASP